MSILEPAAAPVSTPPVSGTAAPPNRAHDVLTPLTLGHPLVSNSTDLYTSPDWLNVEELAHPGHRLYTWVNGDDGAAFTPAYAFTKDSNPWPYARPDLFIDQFRSTAVAEPTADKLLPAYTIGGRRPGHSTFLTAGPPWRRRELLTRLLDTASAHAADRGAACLAALYVSSKDQDLAAAFQAVGAIRQPSYPVNVLTLPGHTWEDWLASLPRKQRAKEKADLRKTEEAGLSFEVGPLRESDLEWVVDLELGLYGKHGHSYAADEATRLHRAYLHHLGDDAVIVRVLHEGQPLGFTSLVRHGRRAYVRQAGFHPALSDTPAYFAAALHQPIVWAYGHGVRHLDLSISADQVKQRRGAQPFDRASWFVPLTSGARLALTSIAGEAAAASASGHES
ncbi:GNAT family N-acetyltransferase [Streptomyces sp. NBC_00199]|uniref:GNAT family N-acetyltransferase n=1 Tax=Streptomyces sp. NBC_00199 TaxID=2975678 RepID=UPI0022592265|nr:GNAT family N-acetyltransferase [Streptomyces sp. NBC_00199]MCX5265949.1 GNAT family N-acetyltransferase [Streptomyces sp. NBC_00199]